MSKHSYYLSVISLILLECCEVSLLATEETPTIDDLILIAKDTRENIHSIDVSFSVTQKVIDSSPTHIKDKVIPYLSERVLVDIKSGRFYWRYNKPSTEGDGLSTTEIAYDGNIQTQHFLDNKSGSITKEKPSSSIDPLKRSRVLGAMFALPPKEGGSGIDDRNMVNFLKHGVLRKNSEDINGHTCLVVDLVVRGIKGATAWIDVDRGLTPLKLVTYNKFYQIASECRMKKLQEFGDAQGNSIWLATEIESIMNFGAFTVQSIVKLNQEKTKVNPVLDDSMFRVQFPPGTEVYDSVANLSFTIPPSEMPELDMDNLNSSDTRLVKKAFSTTSKENVKKSSTPARQNQVSKITMEKPENNHIHPVETDPVSITAMRKRPLLVLVGTGFVLVVVAFFFVMKKKL